VRTAAAAVNAESYFSPPTRSRKVAGFCFPPAVGTILLLSRRFLHHFFHFFPALAEQSASLPPFLLFFREFLTFLENTIAR
jgi:hypothetical protein